MKIKELFFAVIAIYCFAAASAFAIEEPDTVDFTGNTKTSCELAKCPGRPMANCVRTSYCEFKNNSCQCARGSEGIPE